MLTTLYGFGNGGGGGFGTGNAILDFQAAERLAEREQEMVRKDPMIQREVDSFMKLLDKAETPEELLKDPRALEFILRGLMVTDRIGQDALVRQALLSDIDDKKSLANRLGDNRLRQAAVMYDFHESGLSVLKSKEVLEGLVDTYYQQRYEERLAERNPAFPDALYFRRIANDQDLSDPYDVLGDPILRRVVTTALGLPMEIAIQPVETQARAITSRLDLDKLSNPKFVESFIKRFLTADTRAAEAQQGGGGNQPWQLQLFAGLNTSWPGVGNGGFYA